MPLSANRRTCILVLGMHRSGTSALSGLLASLGAQRPKRELSPQPDNKLGFFEPSEVVAIHDRFLAAFGSNWCDWRKLPKDWCQSRQAETALDELETAIRHDFDGANIFFVKDPRICRFPALWIELAKRVEVQLVTLHIFRAPTAVASSLRARDGFHEAMAHLLWLRHILEAEHATRGIPRAVLRYEDLLSDGVVAVENILACVGIALELDAPARDAANKFVDPALNRQSEVSRSGGEALGSWTKSAYDLMDRLRRAPYDRNAQNGFDDLRSQFDSGCDAFGPLLAVANQEVAMLQHNNKSLQALQSERDILFATLQTMKWVADRVPALEAELDLIRSSITN